MARLRESRLQHRGMRFCIIASAMALLSLFAVMQAEAQTYKVLYNFVGQRDGGHPGGNFVIDRAGNLYGAAYAYGYYSVGTIFKLHASGSNWLFSPIYTFTADLDGAYPVGVTIGPDGSLFGATYFGNNGQGCGVIFNVKPSPARPISALQPWTETVDHVFGGGDGCGPSVSVAFDHSGNMYATTPNYGQYNGGTLVELTRSGQSWTSQVIHAFGSGPEGDYPLGPVAVDSAGNLYGNAAFGGTTDGGTIYQMTPSGSGWTLTVLTSFPQSADGYRPYGGVMVDQHGNVYGTTVAGGVNGGGTAFMLSAGSWTFNLLHSFSGNAAGPGNQLVMDAAGNLYGTTGGDGLYQQGNIFKLHPNGDGTYAYTDLYDFTGGSDGGGPSSNLVLDANGDLFGTTTGGGAGVNCEFGCGVVFELTP